MERLYREEVVPRLTAKSKLTKVEARVLRKALAFLADFHGTP